MPKYERSKRQVADIPKNKLVKHAARLDARVKALFLEARKLETEIGELKRELRVRRAPATEEFMTPEGGQESRQQVVSVDPNAFDPCSHPPRQPTVIADNGPGYPTFDPAGKPP